MSRSQLASTLFAAALAVAACTATTAIPVRADLALVPAGAKDASLLVVQYREWTADDRPVPDVELDHSHGPDAVEADEDVIVRAQVDGRDLPIQAVDAVGDRVIVDLDALPPGPQTLRLSVTHEDRTTEWLEVQVLDHRLAPR